MIYEYGWALLVLRSACLSSKHEILQAGDAEHGVVDTIAFEAAV